MKHVASLPIVMGILVMGSGARPASPAPRVESSGALTVFAAASLTDAFQELGKTMERREPGLTVRFNFAGSQQLALQMEQGASADVFASADQRWMTYVDQRHLLADTPATFVRNRLVVIVPKANPARITRLEQLSGSGVKLVLAAEAVPVGRYSRQALQQLAKAPGFPTNYETRVLANTVSQEENVKAVVAKVQLGEADAGIVYRSDVTRAVAPKVRVIDIPDDSNVLASYPIATLKDAKNAKAARAFVALVLSADGQRVLRQNGFLPVYSPKRASAGTRTSP